MMHDVQGLVSQQQQLAFFDMLTSLVEDDQHVDNTQP